MMTLMEEHKTIELSLLKKLFREMLAIIKECHERQIIHRDIKPQNIILSERGYNPKLIDFGLALSTNNQMEAYNYCKCGTMSYIAPEVLMSNSIFYKSYGYKCDIFSFGVIVHMLLMGYNPLANKTETERKNNCHIDIKEEEIFDRYGEECLFFVKKLMASNPKHRYTAE